MKQLPRHLRKAISAQSVTVQELIFEVALCAAGMPPELPMKPDAFHEGAFPRDNLRPEDRDEIREYIYTVDRGMADRYAVGVAVIAGRTAREMDEFFGWEGLAKHKLQWLRRVVRRRV